MADVTAYFFSAHPPTGDPKPGTNYPHSPCRHRHRTLEGATKCATNDGKSQVWHVVEGACKAIHEVKLEGEDYRTWQKRLASVQYGRGPGKLDSHKLKKYESLITKMVERVQKDKSR